MYIYLSDPNCETILKTWHNRKKNEANLESMRWILIELSLPTEWWSWCPLSPPPPPSSNTNILLVTLIYLVHASLHIMQNLNVKNKRLRSLFEINRCVEVSSKAWTKPKKLYCLRIVFGKDTFYKYPVHVYSIYIIVVFSG